MAIWAMHKTVSASVRNKSQRWRKPGSALPQVRGLDRARMRALHVYSDLATAIHEQLHLLPM
jgi:hypothetical protein